MRMIHKTLMTVFFLASLTLPVAADDYAVNSFRVRNDGNGYAADVRLVYKDPGTGKRCNLEISKDSAFGDRVHQGEAKTYGIGRSKIYVVHHREPKVCKEKVPDGSEVWAEIRIAMGETKKCRKDGTKFYYHPKGGTVGYKVAGTTLLNNRCKVKGNGGVGLDDVAWSDGADPRD